jgi:hypothetical protein
MNRQGRFSLFGLPSFLLPHGIFSGDGGITVKNRGVIHADSETRIRGDAERGGNR